MTPSSSGPGSRALASTARAPERVLLLQLRGERLYGTELEKDGLRVTGTARGEPRIVELEEHAFFIATLFIPQARSTPASPHPLVGFAEAAFA